MNFFKHALFLIISSLFLFSSCGKISTSSSSDQLKYGLDSSGTGFSAVQVIIANYCLNCHGAWASYTETDYVNNALVVRNNPYSSSLYVNLRGNDAGVAGTMPIGASNLSNEDMKKIKDWITQML